MRGRPGPFVTPAAELDTGLNRTTLPPAASDVAATDAARAGRLPSPGRPRGVELLPFPSSRRAVTAAVLAGRLSSGVTPAALEALVERIIPHEREEEAQLYPALAAPLGGPEATAPMSRAHAEIQRLTRRLGTHLTQIDASGTLNRGRVDDLLACLYGLHAILALHFIQEEENYFALATQSAPDRIGRP